MLMPRCRHQDASSSERRWQAWGHLASRYRDPAPRRVLALDGGGVRGVITLQVLLRLERLLAAHYGRGPDFRLAHFFDYVGGAGSGALIAAAIARGVAVAEILRFYRDVVVGVLATGSLGQRCRTLYDRSPVLRSLKDLYGAEATLRPEHLWTLLLVVTRDHRSCPCLITSHPAGERSEAEVRLHMPLWKLARANLAHPEFATPESFRFKPGDPSKVLVFADGSSTPYNNPAFLMAREAAQDAHGLGWRSGERELLIVSVGAGSLPLPCDEVEPLPLTDAQRTLQGVLAQAQIDQDLSCRTFGRCVHGPPVGPERADLVARTASGRPVPLDEPLGRSFLYARYDRVLGPDDLRRIGLHDIDPFGVAELHGSPRIDSLESVGHAIAQEVELAHLGTFLERPPWPE